MTRTEIQSQIKFLEKQRDKAVDPSDKKNFQLQIDFYEDELRKLEHTVNQRSTAQSIVGTATRIGAGIVSIVVGEVDACITGNTNEDQVKRKRGKFVDSVEKGAVNLTGTVEKLIKKRRNS